MVERTPWLDAITHLFLVAGIAIVCLPLYYAFVAASLPVEEVLKVPMPLLPGKALIANVREVIGAGNLGRELVNSMIMAVGITVGKIAISVLSAFAITYFRFPFRMTAFWLIFLTLMLPVEVRIVPTYAVAANVLEPIRDVLVASGLDKWATAHFGWHIAVNLQWNLLDSYLGLILPLIASATATFLFRQFFLTVPDELLEAAKIDGASPLRFLWDVLLPMSRTNMVALSVILFVYGWNQYLWPLLITTDDNMTTAVVGMAKLLPHAAQGVPKWNIAMAAALVITLPPVLVVLILQRWFVKGLIDTEK